MPIFPGLDSLPASLGCPPQLPPLPSPTRAQTNVWRSPEHQKEMIRYLRNHANEDGGFGLHIESESTMFGTVFSYVSLRLLGVPADDPTVAAARAWVRGG